jgi:hypothetical protein
MSIRQRLRLAALAIFSPDVNAAASVEENRLALDLLDARMRVARETAGMKGIEAQLREVRRQNKSIAPRS